MFIEERNQNYKMPWILFPSAANHVAKLFEKTGPF